MIVPGDVIEAADGVLGTAWAVDVMDAAEGRVCSVDGDIYLELLSKAETLARWVQKIKEDSHAS
jgi:hypothetical protein